MSAPKTLTDQIIAMRRAGVRVKDIAAALGCSSANVSQCTRKHVGMGTKRFLIEPLPTEHHRFIVRRAAKAGERYDAAARRLLVEAITQAMLEEAS